MNAAQFERNNNNIGVTGGTTRSTQAFIQAHVFQFFFCKKNMIAGNSNSCCSPFPTIEVEKIYEMNDFEEIYCKKTTLISKNNISIFC